ncbi:DNA topoisomerase 6 subunit A [Triticum aestivum]|uniref:DNA topoisomerase 6 subunit A n=2 Tax=Triticum TaxID=4564 RepID=UPI000842B95C|nr:DNA topoisomerase 6 subunit A-like [Triticum aestivum]
MPKIKDIRFILIVEKAAIMSKLVSIEFYKTYRCIILSGKGHSDVATRGVAHKLARQLRVPVYGIADCNPMGAITMLTYKNGSRRRGFDNLNVTVPTLQWIGMHSVHCYRNRSGPRTRRPTDSQPLNQRDRTTLKNLISDLERDKELLDRLDVQEVKLMSKNGFRMNFEQRFPLARNTVDFLAEHIPEMVTIEKPGVPKRKTAVEKSDGDDAQAGKKTRKVTKGKSDGDDTQAGKKTRKVTKGKSDGDDTQVVKRTKESDVDYTQVGKKSDDGNDAQAGKKVTKGNSDGDDTQVRKRTKKATKVQLRGKEAK